MRITDFYIDGFGIYHQCRAASLPPGLTLFIGDNEAGKTTLLSFIRGMLFDFPGKRGAKERVYEPLRGGKLGGRMTLMAHGGHIFHIERADKHFLITNSEHQALSETGRQELFANMSAEAYKTIFAFSLDELHKVSDLHDDSIKTALYGAGAGVAFDQLANAAKVLNDGCRNRFLIRGSVPTINQRLKSLEQTRRELTEAQKELQLYTQGQSRLDELKRFITDKECQIAELSTGKDRLNRLLAAWDTWITWQTLTQQLTQADEIIEQFPLELVETYQKLKTEIQEKSQTRSDAAEQLALLESQCPAKPSEALLNQKTAIYQLHEQKQQFHANQKTAAQLQHDLAALDLQLAESMRTLAGEHPADLMAIDSSMVTREQFRQAAQRLTECSHKTPLAKQRLDTLMEDYRHFLTRLEQAYLPLREYGTLHTLPAACWDKTETLTAFLADQQEKLDSDKRRLDELFKLKNACEADVRELANQQELFTYASQTASRSFSGWLGFQSLNKAQTLLRLLTAIACITLLLKEQWGFAAGAFALFLILQYLLWQMLHRQGTSTADTARADSLAKIIADLQSRQARQYAEMDQLKSSLGVSDKDDANLAVLTESIEQAAQVTLTIAGEFQHWQFQAQQARQQLQDIQVDGVQANKQWQNLLQRQHLPSSFAPEAVQTFLERVGDYQNSRRVRENLIRQQTEIQEQLDAFHCQLNAILQAVGSLPASADTAAFAAEDLFQTLQAAENAANKLEQNQAACRQLRQQLERLDKAIHDKQQAFQAVLAEAHTVSAPEFERRYALFQKQEQLRQELQQFQRDLCQRIGQTDFDSLQNELSRFSLEELHTDYEQTSLAFEDASRQRDQNILEQGKLQKALDQLADSDAVARLRNRQAGLIAEMRQEAWQWSRYRLADYFIAKAKTRYEKQQQPEVIRQAAGALARLTAGRYTDMHVPMDEKAFYVLDTAGQRKSVEQLSRGTAEQLYLSLRFGFIQAHSQAHEPLPLVMDDILVNFDPGRARCAAELLTHWAAAQQILYFTCHPETLSLFQACQPKLAVLTLHDGRIE